MQMLVTLSLTGFPYTCLVRPHLHTVLDLCCIQSCQLKELRIMEVVAQYDLGRVSSQEATLVGQLVYCVKPM